MELNDLSLFISGVENRLEKSKKNTTKDYDLEILRDLGFNIDISKIYIKTWVLNDFSVRVYLEQSFLIEFGNTDLDYVFDIKETHKVEKDLFSNDKIDLLDFNKIFNVFFNTWSIFVSQAKKRAYYYLQREKLKKLIGEFRSKIAIGYDW